ncbi:hypothetical protein BJX68DRAFT_261782 [Aspergillus pseudodeflectus]|uniref:Uncharacterized protein n=1 Tax=Aspergillus pseudodeflectus TaxID=176178 RepID=A0ABR4L468_9EURO
MKGEELKDRRESISTVNTTSNSHLDAGDIDPGGHRRLSDQDPVRALREQSNPERADIDRLFQRGLQALCQGIRDPVEYYTDIDEQQVSEHKILKEANLCLRSSVQQLATENTALKKELSDITAFNKQLAENAEELKKLKEDRKRWEDGIQKIRKLFPDRTNGAVIAMYNRMKLEMAEMSDNEGESDGNTGDAGESEAESSAPEKMSKKDELIKHRLAADNKGSKPLVEYDTTDSETDAKGTSTDRDSLEFDPRTPRPRKRKQTRLVQSQSPRPDFSRRPTTPFWIQAQQRAMTAAGITRDANPVLQSHTLPPASEYAPRIHFRVTSNTDYSADDTQLTLGEHLKKIEGQNLAMHKEIEEQIHRLKRESTAAKERSNQAGTLLRKLQQLGGLLNLSPSEVSTLIDMIKASEFSHAGTTSG